jgi:hypothetical protein
MNDEVNELAQQLFAAKPEVAANVLTSVIHQLLLATGASNSQDNQRLAYERHARDTHLRVLKLIANSKLDFNDGSNIPQSTVAGVKRIAGALESIPLGLPLPLLWPADQAKQGSSTARSRTVSEDSFSSDDSSDDSTPVDELVHRLVVSTDPDFTYQPELFRMSPPTSETATNAAPPADTFPGPHFWAYGSLYRMEYPDAIAADDANDNLEQMGLKLPRVVLDLGRLVVTSECEERADGSTWSPSDFAVMVDLESKDRPVWLVCDNSVVSELRFINSSDGMADDLGMVWSLFDSDAMDMTLLFPRIDDWTSGRNKWAALHDRVSKTAMKVGLRLRTL